MNFDYLSEFLSIKQKRNKPSFIFLILKYHAVKAGEKGDEDPSRILDNVLFPDLSLIDEKTEEENKNDTPDEQGKSSEINNPDTEKQVEEKTSSNSFTKEEATLLKAKMSQLVGVLMGFITFSQINLGGMVNSFIWSNSMIAIKSVPLTKDDYLLFTLKINIPDNFPINFSIQGTKLLLEYIMGFLHLINPTFHEITEKYPYFTSELSTVFSTIKQIFSISEENDVLSPLLYIIKISLKKNSLAFLTHPQIGFGFPPVIPTLSLLFSIIRSKFPFLLGQGFYFVSLPFDSNKEMFHQPSSIEVINSTFSPSFSSVYLPYYLYCSLKETNPPETIQEDKISQFLHKIWCKPSFVSETFFDPYSSFSSNNSSNNSSNTSNNLNSNSSDSGRGRIDDKYKEMTLAGFSMSWLSKDKVSQKNEKKSFIYVLVSKQPKSEMQNILPDIQNIFFNKQFISHLLNGVDEKCSIDSSQSDQSILSLYRESSYINKKIVKNDEVKVLANFASIQEKLMDPMVHEEFRSNGQYYLAGFKFPKVSVFIQGNVHSKDNFAFYDNAFLTARKFIGMKTVYENEGS